jgi:hypothetical protein
MSIHLLSSRTPESLRQSLEALFFLCTNNLFRLGFPLCFPIQACISRDVLHQVHRIS